MSLNCMIIDDEPDAVNLLELLIGQSTAWNLKAKCYNALEALAYLKNHRVDFIFLDINMPQLSGMELAGLLPEGTKIIFTTAYSEYAFESFAFETIDYLLKPITLKRFLASVQKIEQYFLSREIKKTAGTDASQESFFVKSGKAIRKVYLKDILYFEGERDYVSLVTAEERLLVYRRLKDIEEQLDLPFIRIHHSYIINYEQFHKIEENHVYIADKRISVSEKFRERFMDLINQKRF